MGLSHSLGYALGSPYGIPRKYSRVLYAHSIIAGQTMFHAKQSLRHFIVFYLLSAMVIVVAIVVTSRRTPLQGSGTLIQA